LQAPGGQLKLSKLSKLLRETQPAAKELSKEQVAEQLLKKVSLGASF
jgi:hypothetical protein